MARTAKKQLPIYDGGVLLAADANSINFTGSVSGNVDGGGNVTQNITGGSAGTPVNNEIVSGSVNTYTLAYTPVAGSLIVFARGQLLYPTSGYTLSGNIITTLDTWSA
jgi:hypothetical protein